MANTPLPKVSVGDSQLASVLNRLLRNLEERTPLKGENYEIAQTSKGFRLIIAPPKPAGDSTGDTIVAAPLNMVWRGEYNIGSNYSPGDVVGVYGGDNAGAFMATVPVPAGSSEEPGVGNSWQRLSSFTFGQWS